MTDTYTGSTQYYLDMIEILTDEVDDLKTEALNLEAQYDALAEELGSRQEQVEDLEVELKDLTDQLKESNDKVEDLEVELKDLTDQLKESNDKVADLEAEQELNEKIIGDLENTAHETEVEFQKAVSQICGDMSEL